MAGEKRDVLLIGARKPVLVKGLESKVNLHYLLEAKDPDAFVKEVGSRIGAIAVAYTSNKVDGGFMARFPKLEQISSFGVGYDHIDAKWAGAHGIVVTNTPDVLNEEVADTALGVDANVELELEGAGNAAERIVARREIAEPQAHVLSCLEIERVGPKTKAHDPHVGRRRGYVEDGGLAGGGGTGW